jgi:transposase InsO family protein
MREWRSAADWAAAAKAAGVTVEVMPITKRNINALALRDSWPSRPRAGAGGGVEYPLSALPEAARLLISRFELAEAAQAGKAEALRAEMTSTLDARAQLAARTAGLSAFLRLRPDQQAEAEAKAALVDACDQYIRRLGLPVKRGTEIFAAEYSAGRVPVAETVAARLPKVSRGSIENWRRELAGHGLAGLASKYGQHRKGTGKIDGNPEMAQFLRAMLTDYPHAGAGLVMKGLRARFGDDIPDLRSVQRWLKGWKEDNEQVLTRIANPDKWKNRYMAAVGSAAVGIVEINQRWELDSTKADLMLADGQRHVVVGVIDVFTRRMKLLVSRSSSAAAVAALLRRAILGWGVPAQAGTDNGSDYVSQHIKRVFVGLGIEQDLAAPFTPEHKPFIERGLGTFSHDLVELAAGYIGHSVADRKDIEARRSFAQRLMKQGERVEMRMSADELQSFCDQWTDNVYAHAPHAGLKGRTPFDMERSWTGPVARIGDERALDVLLSPAPGEGLRTITKKGLRLDNATFLAPELGGMEGQAVRVLLDEADIGRAYVFDEDGAYICVAECPERTGISRQELAAKTKAHQKKVVAEQVAALKADRKAAKTDTIVREILEERAEAAGKLARLPHPATDHTTTALVEAAKAARHGQAPTPAPVSAAEQARIDRLAAEINTPAEVVRLQSPEERFSRVLEIENRIKAGDAVSAEDRRWAERQARLPDIKTRRMLFEDFGEAVLTA